MLQTQSMLKLSTRMDPAFRLLEVVSVLRSHTLISSPTAVSFGSQLATTFSLSIRKLFQVLVSLDAQLLDVLIHVLLSFIVSLRCF